MNTTAAQQLSRSPILAGLILLLPLTSGCLSTGPRLTMEQVRESVKLHIDSDITMDGKIDAQDRKAKDSELLILGINNGDADDDGRVDWNNNKVEAFENLGKLILRRCAIPSGPFTLYLVARSVPVKTNNDTGLYTAGHVRLFSSKGRELLPPGENASKRLPGEYVRLLSKKDLILYVEGVHGFNSSIGVELRTRDGDVLTSDYQEVTMIGPTAIKITRETKIMPYQVLASLHGVNRMIIGDFAVADELIKAILQKDRWEKPTLKQTTSPLAKIVRWTFLGNKQYVRMGGKPDSINTRRALRSYVSRVLQYADAYARKGKNDTAVGTHILTLITYLNKQEDEDLDFTKMLRLCHLAERTGAGRISDTSKKTVDALKRRCRKNLGRVQEVNRSNKSIQPTAKRRGG